MRVCIDAGHDAKNVNASPDKTYYEHEFCLDVAQRIKAHLERAGLIVVMTRTGGEEVSLAERCRIANDAKADVFVSIHTNAAGGAGWYTAQDGLRWNTVEGWSAHVIKKGFGAERLAEAIRAHAILMLGCKDRGVREDNYQVLRDTNMPAVLIEHGFHTHREEVEKLKTDSYRALCAESDARGVCDYLGVKWDDEPIIETPECRFITVEELKAMGYSGIMF